MTLSSQSGENGTKTSGDHNTEADFHGFLRDDRPSKPKKAVSSQWKDVKELLALLTHFPPLEPFIHRGKAAPKRTSESQRTILSFIPG